MQSLTNAEVDDAQGNSEEVGVLLEVGMYAALFRDLGAAHAGSQ